MEFKGTKGEWEVNVIEQSNGYAYINNGFITIYGGVTKELGTIDEECKANAKLIASAPEMFEMLKEVLKENHCTPDLDNEIKQLLTKITE